jgi:hypothetical protein
MTIINQSLDKLREHFVNSEHHHHVFSSGENYRALFDIARESLVAMFESQENQARLAAFIASHGEEKAIHSIANQGKALILQGLLVIAKA